MAARTWTAGGPDHPVRLVSAFQGDGKARGSNGNSGSRVDHRCK